jgi:RimJ/RimL family protein N-acetyltransferase
MADAFPFGQFDMLKMRELLLTAEADPLLAGYVYPDDETKARLPIYNGEKLIGFATPRQDKDEVWRMGAIYILPEHRGHGLGRNAIASFMKGRRGRAFIEDDNIASQRAYEAAGFKVVKADPKNHGSWWENF